MKSTAQKLKEILYLPKYADLAPDARLLIFGTYKTLEGFADSLAATLDTPEDHEDILALAHLFTSELKPLLEKRGISW
jgi:hypothetical protein